MPLRSTVVYGGIPMDPQIKALRGGIEILVATPGRLLDLVGQKVANLGQVEILVLDEADRMLDMGFLPDIQKIIALLPDEAPEPDVLGDLLGRHPASVGDDPARPRDRRGRAAEHGAEAVRQLVYPVDRDRKEALLAHLIRKNDMRQVLVFTRTKLAATRLANRLDREGLDAVAIHSDRSQPERTRALEGFKTGEIRVLVATDVAARGLDIEDLPVVVNFELPWNPQDYIHRIGRTGRAGATGEAISLVCIDETDLLRGVQRMLKHAIPWTVEEGFIPDRNVEPRPLGARAGHARGRPSTTRTASPSVVGRVPAAAADEPRRPGAQARPRAIGGYGRARPAGCADRVDDGAREEEAEHAGRRGCVRPCSG